MLIQTKNITSDGRKNNLNEEVKVIKQYPNFFLVEYKAGYKECIHKQDLGLIKEVETPKNVNPEKYKLL